MSPSVVTAAVLVTALITREAVRVSSAAQRWSVRSDVIIAILTVIWLTAVAARVLSLLPA